MEVIRRVINAILLAGSLSAARPAAAQTFDPRYPVCIEASTIDCSAESPAGGRPIAAATEPILPNDPLSERG